MGQFRLEGLKPDNSLSAATGKVSGDDDDGILVYRYIPKVGRDFKGQSEASYTVFVPFAEDAPQPVTQKVWNASKLVSRSTHLTGMHCQLCTTSFHGWEKSRFTRLSRQSWLKV